MRVFLANEGNFASFQIGENSVAQAILVAAGGGGCADQRDAINSPDARGLIHPRAALHDLVKLVPKADVNAGTRIPAE